jgi:hypothetical protein
MWFAGGSLDLEAAWSSNRRHLRSLCKKLTVGCVFVGSPM